MDRDSAEILVSLANKANLDDVDLYENYSGRYMYGEITTGVKNLDISGLLYIIEYLYNESERDIYLDLCEVRTDTLGYGNIIY